MDLILPLESNRLTRQRDIFLQELVDQSADSRLSDQDADLPTSATLTPTERVSPAKFALAARTGRADRDSGSSSSTVWWIVVVPAIWTDKTIR